MSWKYVLLVLLINNILGEEQYYIKIKDKEYQFQLEESETVNQLKSKFPLTVSMTNLNGNEVYYRFNGESFPTNEQSIGTINQGDIYLYQNNFLVLFYKTFTTSYRYTKIGKVINPAGLDTLIGSDNVEVMWFVKSDTEENPKDSSSDSNDSTDDSTKVSDSTETKNDDGDEDENGFDNYNSGSHGFQRFKKSRLKYSVWLFLALIL